MWLTRNGEDELQFALDFGDTFGVIGVLICDPCRIGAYSELGNVNGGSGGWEESEVRGIGDAFGAGQVGVARDIMSMPGEKVSKGLFDSERTWHMRQLGHAHSELAGCGELR